jgi:hypothetical protein
LRRGQLAPISYPASASSSASVPWSLWCCFHCLTVRSCTDFV